MPAIVVDLQKRFKLVIREDIPQGVVETAQDGDWLRCCPLCGCIHKIDDLNGNRPYTPLCQTMPFLFKSQQDSWRKLYPDVAKYSTLSLVMGAK